MEKSREILTSKLGKRPDTFAYPYGAGEDDPAIRDQAKAAGYRIAVGVHAGKWNVDEFKASAYNLPRAFVRGDESLFDFHIQMTRGRSRF
jgi:peptidoglycan/xylan/chitin deacetylase (PgdA/CDA1 family)